MSKKSIAMVLLLSMYVFTLIGQNSDWEWVQSFGGVSLIERYDYASPGESFVSPACDKSGNIYVVGSMLDEAYAGDIHLQGRGDIDVVVAKLDPQGRYIWATNLGGEELDVPSALSLDASGNAYITGIFFGTLRLGGFTLQSRGDSDIFVAKISPDGVWQWIRQAGSQVDGEDSELLDEIGELSVDIQTNAQGSSVILGIAQGKTHFGSHTLNCRGEEWFLASIDTDGNWTWAKSLGGRINGEIIRNMAMTLDHEDNILTVASAGSEEYLEEFIEEDGLSYADEAPSKAPASDSPGFMGVSKHSSDGENIWRKTTPRALLHIKRIVSDEMGNLFVTAIGNGVEYSKQESRNKSVAFVAKVDSLGDFDWIQGISSVDYDFLNLSLALGSDSKLYVVGEEGAMVSSYDIAGNLLWAESLSYGEGDGTLKVLGLALDKQNGIVISGHFSGQITLGSILLESDSWGDAFVGKYISRINTNEH